MPKTSVVTSGMNTSKGSLPIKRDSTSKSGKGADITAAYKNAPGPRSETGTKGS